MVGVVAEQHQTVGLDFEVEAAVHASVGTHAVAQLFGVAAGQLGHGHGGDAILNINRYGMAERYVPDTLDGRDEVEGDVAVLNLDVLGVEVALGQCVSV